jgi:hypothetical protein
MKTPVPTAAAIPEFASQPPGGGDRGKRLGPSQPLRIDTWLLATILLAVLAAGCGQAGHSAARLEGAVTLDGNPIAEGSMQFVPEEASRSSPVGAVIKAGRYVVPSAPLGKVRVLISATRKTGRMISEYSQPYEEIVNIIPASYHQGIEIEVTGDDPNLNFELRSR